LTFDGTTADYGATVIGSNGFDMNGLLHEMLHAYPVAGSSMPHGRSAFLPGQDSPADYRDPYDVMSAFNNYTDGTGPWGPQAGNLGAAVRELAGFMPDDRRLDYVPDEKCVCYRNTTLTLRSYNTKSDPTKPTLGTIEHDAFHARIWGGLHFRTAMEDAYAIGHEAANEILGKLH